MESLDSTWIQNAEKKCPEKTSSPATLGLQNMAGQYLARICVFLSSTAFTATYVDVLIVLCCVQQVCS